MMHTKTAFAIVFLVAASATGLLLGAPVARAADAPASGGKEVARMVELKDQDVSGEVFQRFGLPSQHYCLEKCLQETRCAATRWGVVEGSTAGQCQLLSGKLTFGETRDLKTSDGLRILVTASKKQNVAADAAM